MPFAHGKGKTMASKKKATKSLKKAKPLLQTKPLVAKFMLS